MASIFEESSYKALIEFLTQVLSVKPTIVEQNKVLCDRLLSNDEIREVQRVMSNKVEGYSTAHSTIFVAKADAVVCNKCAAISNFSAIGAYPITKKYFKQEIDSAVRLLRASGYDLGAYSFRYFPILGTARYLGRCSISCKTTDDIHRVSRTISSSLVNLCAFSTNYYPLRLHVWCLISKK